MSVVNNTFTKICNKKFVKDYVKEAKKVKYNIKELRMDNTILSYTITDPTYADALVFKAVVTRPDVWIVTFSRDYFEEPKGIRGL